MVRKSKGAAPKVHDEEDELLSLSAAARLLQASESSVRRWADDGKLPVVRTPGGQRRFRRADVIALLRAS
jgi:excisionase family DNA binding protein